MALYQILHDVSRCRKFKMAADKPEIHYIAGVFQDTVLKFRHPVTSGNNRSSAIEFWDPENIDLAVGISFISYLEADI